MKSKSLLNTDNSPRVQKSSFSSVILQSYFTWAPFSMHKESLGSNWPGASADKLVQELTDKPEPESIAVDVLFQGKICITHDQMFGFCFVSARNLHWRIISILWKAHTLLQQMLVFFLPSIPFLTIRSWFYFSWRSHFIVFLNLEWS